MSLQAQILQHLQQLTSWKNSLMANSKRIDELPTATAGTKYVAVWNADASLTQKITRDALVDQDNKGRKIFLGYFTTNSPVLECVTKLNQLTTVVGEKDTPVIFEAQKFVPEANQFIKYVFLWLGGKGTHGQGGTTVNASKLYMLPAENITVQDINPDATTTIIALGELEAHEDFIEAANAQERSFDETGMSYYFSYFITENEGTPQEQEVLYIVLFVGEPGIYGGPDPGTTDFVQADFVATTNSTVAPGPATPGINAVLGMGYQAINKEIGLFWQAGTPNEVYTEWFGGGWFHENPQGGFLEMYFRPVGANQGKIWIPSVIGEDEFALVSQVNGLAIQVNQSTAELSILNNNGDILATANLAFLNNEGTAFTFNDTTDTLELRDQAGTLLSSIPVSAFVANIAHSATFNSSTPSILEFKDAQNNIVYSVPLAIANVSGLQAALDALVVPDASLTTKGKIKLAKDLGGTAAEPQVVKLTVVADVNATARRAVLVEQDGTPVGEATFEFAMFDETPTGYADLAALVAEYPSVVGGELVRPQGFRVYCFLMTPPTTYIKCADNDLYWIKHTNTTVT